MVDGDKDETHPGGEDPAAVYSARLIELKSLQSIEQRRERRLGYSKLVIGTLTLIAAILLLHFLKALELLIIPVAAFVVLAVMQEKLIARLRIRSRSVEFYERGTARLEDRWQGSGESGERFLDASHPYARDLDLFGSGSLYELLCTALTRSGQATLAAWLLKAADVDEVHRRQRASLELKSRVDLRERLFSLGEAVRANVNAKSLAAWGTQGPLFGELTTRIVTRVLAALWLASLIAWAVWGLGDVAAAMTILNLAWAHRIHKRLNDAAGGLEKAADDLELLAGILSLFETEQFESEKLTALQASIWQEAVAASRAIHELARVEKIIRSRHSLFLRPLDLVVFWSAQLVFKAERWQRQFGPKIAQWVNAVGELEALLALAGYAYEHPQDVFPEFVANETNTTRALFDAEGLAHPLLPASAVRNDLRIDDRRQLVLLSGPNMAGKSTFMRSVGVTAVLAQCGAPVRAARLRMSPLTVAVSICVLDSLAGGVSRFYAEIQRVKLICDLAVNEAPVLFLLDELLSGTNSHDRLQASEFVAHRLLESHAIGIVSTHDLSLTRIAEELGERAANLHFSDQVIEGRLVFDFKLKPGVVQTSNAFELMRAIGLGVDS